MSTIPAEPTLPQSPEGDELQPCVDAESDRVSQQHAASTEILGATIGETSTAPFVPPAADAAHDRLAASPLRPRADGLLSSGTAGSSDPAPRPSSSSDAPVQPAAEATEASLVTDPSAIRRAIPGSSQRTPLGWLRVRFKGSASSSPGP